jgi:hypothetical protein
MKNFPKLAIAIEAIKKSMKALTSMPLMIFSTFNALELEKC